MLALASRLRPVWPWLALLGSGALLAGAHAFQYFGGLAPCPLCLDQRNWHWAVIGVAALALVVMRFRPGWARGAALAVGLVLAGSAAMGAYHVAVEQHWIMAQCDARVNVNDLSFDMNAEVVAPKCEEIAWSMLGISMAGYNALISLFLALASFAIAFLPERKA